MRLRIQGAKTARGCATTRQLGSRLRARRRSYIWQDYPSSSLGLVSLSLGIPLETSLDYIFMTGMS